MPASKKNSKIASKKNYVERALEGMTRRMERGESLSDLEVPLYLLMLKTYASRELVNYNVVFQEMRDRLQGVEDKLQSQVSLRTAVQGSRRIPQPNLGPPNQSPFDG